MFCVLNKVNAENIVNTGCIFSEATMYVDEEVCSYF